MTYYVLVLIVLSSFQETVAVSRIGQYQDLSKCFDAREQIVKKLGRPIVNYQAICVIKEKSI